MNAAILFEPDGYLLTGPRLMGRQAAGNGFLRAAVAARGEAPLSAFTPHRQSAEIFQQTVTALDPAAQTAWIPAQRLDLLAQIGVLYRPDQLLGIQARQRLRIGPGAYSLCGVTHTLSTQGTLDAIAKILTEPVMPWDALVCTSNVAKAVVTAVLDHQADYLRWRTRQPAPEGRPLLPVIPLGVHCDDFAFTADDRATARQALGLAQADVAVLFAGRLSINGKAHPHALLHALQTLVTETGSPVVLVIAGQAYNKDTDALFRSGLADFCPSVRTVFVDGKDPAAFRSAWAGSDIFASLADSIQETFGLTPLEAMASGLPALVTDWNGYRDTVRDGVDGFRIKTWAPPPGAGESIAALFEAGAINYEGYLSRSGTGVAVDNVELAERLRALVADPDLRRRMGEAGRARARAEFDWSVVFRRYQALWAEQGLLRRKAADDPTVAAWLASAPRTGADHLGPFDTFASYPTHQISPATLVTRAPQASGEAYRQLIASRIMALWTLAPEVVDNVLSALADGPLSIADLGAATGITSPMIAEVAARLAKMGVLHLSADDGA